MGPKTAGPTTGAAPLPFGPLRYLYVGSSDVAADVAFFREGGAIVLWDITSEEARVTAVRVGPGPVVLLADHRAPGSVLPIHEVPSLASSQERLEKAGWVLHDPGFETPEGPARIVRGPSGNEWAILQVTRPDVFG